MLRLLQGRRHRVCTGVALWRLGAIRDAVEATAVDFSPMTAEEIEWYVASGEPFGKAGAYAIQGLASRFVSRIEGSYSNVVGLPIALVHRLLAARVGSRTTRTKHGRITLMTATRRDPPVDSAPRRSFGRRVISVADALSRVLSVGHP